MKTKILIADDHAILRGGLKTVLETQDNFVVLGETDNGEDAVKLAADLKPDVVILDINMPGINGIEAAKKIKATDVNTKILVLTMYESEKIIIDSFSAGIDGYLVKMSDMDEFIKAVKVVASGEQYFQGNISKVILSNLRNLAKNETLEHEKNTLTRREIEIIRLIANGHTSQEIAEKLFISYFTVGQHRKNIMSKLKLKNTVDLVHYAIHKKIIHEE